MDNKVFRLLQSEPSDGQPMLEWVNGPERWEPQLNRHLPDLPVGPVPDHGDSAQGVGSGLPIFAEHPVFVVDRPLNQKKPLFEVFNGRRDTLVVNERAKRILEGTDAQAFAFCEVDVKLCDGKPGPPYWLCDVIRVIDAFDREAFGGARVTQADPYRYVISPYREKNLFKRSAIDAAHFFRLLHSPGGVYCDGFARAAINAPPKLRGVFCVPVGALD